MQDQLKAPSSAKFPTLEYETTYLGDNTFRVKSYVDAQNTFGAQIRTDYEVVLKWNGKERTDQRNWNLISVTINP